MGRKMDRGKRAVLFEYLPGKTYDFERTAVIARTRQIRSTPNTELNKSLILAAIERAVGLWLPAYRRQFPDNLSDRTNSFILVEPLGVAAEMFPMVLWCQNRSCSRVYDFAGVNTIPTKCPTCGTGRLEQLRFVRVHRCGALLPLDFFCRKCGSRANMALITRGSERIADFRWICRSCGSSQGVSGGRCPECDWDTPVDRVADPRKMNIEVHRAGRTYYPHYVTLLNQPKRELGAFLELNEWQAIAGATYLEFPETTGRQMLDFAHRMPQRQASGAVYEMSEGDLARFRAQGFSDENIEVFQRMQRQLRQGIPEPAEDASPQSITRLLKERTGIGSEVWNEAGREMLEAVLPMQSGDVKRLFEDQAPQLETARSIARHVGLDRITLVADFPITTATYGFSRVDYRPGLCYVNPFPPDRDHENKFPIFVDMVQADAIMLRLDAQRVCRWLDANGMVVALPNGTGHEALRQQAYFVDLFNRVTPRETLDARVPQARMVFCLLHSLCHLCVRCAALLCGLDRTSLSEYVLPKSLSFAVYCSHGSGATIGALTALFEQSLSEWLNQVLESRRCVYDPVCTDQGGSCHACLHLAETSCQYFNLNLGRSFLFGGRDAELGDIKGYL